MKTESFKNYLTELTHFCSIFCAIILMTTTTTSKTSWENIPYNYPIWRGLLTKCVSGSSCVSIYSTYTCIKKALDQLLQYWKNRMLVIRNIINYLGFYPWSVLGVYIIKAFSAPFSLSTCIISSLSCKILITSLLKFSEETKNGYFYLFIFVTI